MIHSRPLADRDHHRLFRAVADDDCDEHLGVDDPRPLPCLTGAGRPGRRRVDISLKRVECSRGGTFMTRDFSATFDWVGCDFGPARLLNSAATGDTHGAGDSTDDRQPLTARCGLIRSSSSRYQHYEASRMKEDSAEVSVPGIPVSAVFVPTFGAGDRRYYTPAYYSRGLVTGELPGWRLCGRRHGSTQVDFAAAKITRTAPQFRRRAELPHGVITPARSFGLTCLWAASNPTPLPA